MDLRVFTEPQQGASYQDLLATALAAEASGFSGFFRSDHYLKMGNVTGLPGPSHAWLSLAGLARDTSTIRLGTLVSPVTFYQPGPLAIMVAQVDAMSNGRVEFGFGSGWYEDEHRAYGLPFPPLGERFDRFEEAMEQIHGLWLTPEGSEFNHEGKFHSFSNCPALPKPAQQPYPPVVIGGRGQRRTPALAARYASEFNIPFTEVEKIPEMLETLDRACEVINRHPSEIVRSATLILCLGASEAEVQRRSKAIGRSADQLRIDGLAGSVDEVLAKLETYSKAGIQRMYVQILDLRDLEHIELAGHDLIPAIAGW